MKHATNPPAYLKHLVLFTKGVSVKLNSYIGKAQCIYCYLSFFIVCPLPPLSPINLINNVIITNYPCHAICST